MDTIKTRPDGQRQSTRTSPKRRPVPEGLVSLRTIADRLKAAGIANLHRDVTHLEQRWRRGWFRLMLAQVASLRMWANRRGVSAEFIRLLDELDAAGAAERTARAALRRARS